MISMISVVVCFQWSDASSGISWTFSECPKSAWKGSEAARSGPKTARDASDASSFLLGGCGPEGAQQHITMQSSWNLHIHVYTYIYISQSSTVGVQYLLQMCMCLCLCLCGL